MSDLCRESYLTISNDRVRWGRASRKALAFRRDTDKVRKSLVTCCQIDHGIKQAKKRSCGIIFMRHLSDTVGGVNLFIVGRLETDSSKGIVMCRVWDCLQLRAVKTPDT